LLFATGPELPGLSYPPPGGAEDPADIRELPLVIQDRVFERDSKLWYPVAETPKSMAFPAGVQPPLWIPGFTFGPDASSPVMMTVNGKTWPKKVGTCFDLYERCLRPNGTVNG
jgi:hypothetical protein